MQVWVQGPGGGRARGVLSRQCRLLHKVYLLHPDSVPKLITRSLGNTTVYNGQPLGPEFHPQTRQLRVR